MKTVRRLLVPGDRMKRLGLTLACLLLVACASARAERREASMRAELWRQAYVAMNGRQYARADTLFGTLIRDYGDSQTGRESLFYLGALRLDPRNPNWSSELAETSLELYLRADSAGRMEWRRPEARTLYELARQLNLPTEARVPGLQAETRVVEVERRVVVPAREATTLQAEVTRLREQLALREQQIKRQEEELDRIRKTLSGTGARE